MRLTATGRGILAAAGAQTLAGLAARLRGRHPRLSEDALYRHILWNAKYGYLAVSGEASR